MNIKTTRTVRVDLDRKDIVRVLKSLYPEDVLIQAIPEAGNSIEWKLDHPQTSHSVLSVAFSRSFDGKGE